MAEDGTALELEVLPSVGVLDDDVGADDVSRHQVRRELDPRERQIQALRQRPDEEGLAEARHALEQHVAAGKQADQHVRDDLVVPHDDLADLGAQGPERGDEVRHAPFLGLDRLGRLRHPRLLSHRVSC